MLGAGKEGPPPQSEVTGGDGGGGGGDGDDGVNGGERLPEGAVNNLMSLQDFVSLELLVVGWLGSISRIYIYSQTGMIILLYDRSTCSCHTSCAVK